MPHLAIIGKVPCIISSNLLDSYAFAGYSTSRKWCGHLPSSSSDGARGFRSDSHVLCTHPNIIESSLVLAAISAQHY
jgi:hypothetical protein